MKLSFSYVVAHSSAAPRGAGCCCCCGLFCFAMARHAAALIAALGSAAAARPAAAFAPPGWVRRGAVVSNRSQQAVRPFWRVRCARWTRGMRGSGGGTQHARLGVREECVGGPNPRGARSAAPRAPLFRRFRRFSLECRAPCDAHGGVHRERIQTRSSGGSASSAAREAAQHAKWRPVARGFGRKQRAQRLCAPEGAVEVLWP